MTVKNRDIDVYCSRFIVVRNDSGQRELGDFGDETCNAHSLHRRESKVPLSLLKLVGSISIEAQCD